MEENYNDAVYYQRDYVELIGELVYRPLADPLCGAVIRSSDNRKHIKNISDLNERIKKMKHNVPLVSLGIFYL